MKLSHHTVIYLCVTVYMKLEGIGRVMGVGDRVSMTSTTPLQGVQCGGPVTITCRADRLAGVFWWINQNPSPVARFTQPSQELRDQLPVNLTSEATLNLGWVVLLTGLSAPNNSQYNFTTTIETTTAELVQRPLSSIWCGRNLFNSSLNVSLSVRELPATPNDVPCSLMPNPALSLVSMTLYLADYIERNSIDRYRVTVTSTQNIQTICSGDFTHGIYICNGLHVGTDYALTLRGFNCVTKGGGTDSFRIYAQAPNVPTIQSVQGLYDETTRLIWLNLKWAQQFTPSVSGRCPYSDSVRYEVIVVSLNGQEQYSAMATAEACKDGVCSISLNISSTSITTYNVSMLARNDFGASVTAYHKLVLASTSSKLLDHSFSFSNCITYALCTSPLQVENCTVKYSTNSSYPDSSPQITGPLNSSFQLPLLRRLTVYYHEAIISITSSSSVIVRKQFKTGDFAIRLTSQNIALITMGSILLALSLAPLIINIVLIITMKPLLGKIIVGIILASQVVTVTSAVILWMVTGEVVSSQANTCDEHWQRRRNTLIIAAHVLSDIALLVSIPAIVISLFIKLSIKEVKKVEPVYNSQYDYIDKSKAEERGIYMKQNYAYCNPFKKKKKATMKPDGQVGAFYADTSGAPQNDIRLKTNYAYRSTFKSKKASQKPSKNKDLKLKSKDIYAPPMKMTDDQNMDETSFNVPSASNKIMAENEKKQIQKPQIHPRKIYASPVLAQSSDNNEKSSSSKGEVPKHEYSYVTSSMKCDQPKAIDKPSKRSKDIKLKENCAYTESAAHGTDNAQQVYSDGYVGPVVPPVQHTEGISLKNNYAYKVGGLKGKLKTKK